MIILYNIILFPPLIWISYLLLFMKNLIFLNLLKYFFYLIFFSIIFSKISYDVIPLFKVELLKIGLYGIDLNKQDDNKKKLKKQKEKEKEKIPESLGIVISTLYFILLIIIMSLIHMTHINVFNIKDEEVNDFRISSLFLPLISICFIMYLGLLDDLLNLKWRFKIVIPIISILPLILNYNGTTEIILPNFIGKFLNNGNIIDLGIFYYIYIIFTCIFYCNSINIYAGINGIEIGQSYIISNFVILFNLMEINQNNIIEGINEGINVITSQNNQVSSSINLMLLSIVYIIPFIFLCASLLIYNWYPSKVFVGDSFTYFAGIIFSVVSIIGHFSKTLLLFFVPQLLNFLLSLPQILGLFGIKCPRHRLPHYNSKTNKLEYISNHHTLINLTLYIFGPLNEEILCVYLLIFQFLCCCIGLYMRYVVSNVIWSL